MPFNRIKKEDVDDVDFINSYELYSDGYGTNSVYLSTTCVSTTSGTKTVVIDLAPDGQGIFYSSDHPAQPDDVVWISGTSGGDGDGYFTINTVVDDLTFIINETFGSSTGGTVRFQYKSGASNIGYDSRGDSVIAHNNIQDALKAIDSSVSVLSALPADSFIGNITGDSAPADNISLLSIDSTSIIYDVVSHTFQRAALTGAITSSLNSNTTAFGVLAALSVLANATNASAVPSALAGTTAFQHLRVNSAGTGLEWSVFTAGDFPAGIVPLTTLATQATDTFIANVSGSTATPIAVNLSTLAGTGLVFGTHTLDVTAGAGGSLIVGANDIQRAALTGAVVASQDSNATTFGVLAAKSVLSNATNSSAAPAALAGSAAFQHLRVNSANNALEWSLLTAGDFPSGIVPVTAVDPGTSGQVLLSNATPVATWTTLTGDVTVGATGVTDIASGVIVNSDVNASAGIVYSKLNLTGGIVNADINASAAIAYSKLNLATSIVNADISASAAIVYSKLNLAGGIVNADINASAAIAVSKLASGTAGQFLLNNSTPTPTWTSPSGDLTISNTGAFAVKDITGNSGTVNIASTGNTVVWSAAASTPTITQNNNTTNGAIAANMFIAAQTATGTTSTGGTLVLTSGAGTTAAGPVLIGTGGTTRLTANATGVITIANLSTGIVHADSSGNLTSSTIVNADVNASAAIAYSKLNLATSIVNADIATAAAIAVSKLAAGTSAQILMNNATPTPTYTTISGDATLSSAGAIAVTDITGASGTVDIASTGNIITWASATTAPGITQNFLSAPGTGQTLLIQAQNSATNGAGGILDLRSGTGTTASGAMTLRTGSTTRLTLNATGVITIANLSTGLVHADSSGNLTSSLLVNADVNASAAIDYSKLNLATSIVNADVSTSAAIAVSKLAAGTSGQVLMNNSTPTPTYTTISGDATLSSAGAIAVTDITGSGGFVDIASTGNVIRWASATTAPGIMQTNNTTNSATAAAMTIQAQNATGTTATGGILDLRSGTGTTASGGVSVRTGGDIRINIPGNSNLITFNNSAGTLGLTLEASPSIPKLLFAAAATIPSISQSDKTTNNSSGAPLLIQAQNETGTTSTGGILDLRSGTGTSNDGNITFRNGTTVNTTLTPSTMLLNSDINFVMPERAVANKPDINAGQGCFWVRSDTPSMPMFSDDTDVIVPIKNCVKNIVVATSVSNSTTTVNICPAFTIPANSLVVGSSFRCTWSYNFVRGGTATACNINNNFTVESVTLGKAINISATAGDYFATGVATFTILTIGSSGTWMGHISITVANTTSTSTISYQNATTSGTINTTLDRNVFVAINMSAAVSGCAFIDTHGSTEWLR